MAGHPLQHPPPHPSRGTRARARPRRRVAGRTRARRHHNSGWRAILPTLRAAVLAAAPASRRWLLVCLENTCEHWRMRAVRSPFFSALSTLLLRIVTTSSSIYLASFWAFSSGNVYIPGRAARGKVAPIRGMHARPCGGRRRRVDPLPLGCVGPPDEAARRHSGRGRVAPDDVCAGVWAARRRGGKLAAVAVPAVMLQLLATGAHQSERRQRLRPMGPKRLEQALAAISGLANPVSVPTFRLPYSLTECEWAMEPEKRP